MDLIFFLKQFSRKKLGNGKSDVMLQCEIFFRLGCKVYRACKT